MTPQPFQGEVELEALDEHAESWREEDEDIGYSDGVPVDETIE